MNNNDILRRLRYTFELNDDHMMRLYALAQVEVTRAQISSWLKKEEDPDFKQLYDKELSPFLNGLIVDRRGKKEGVEIINEKSLNNNQILRKLKIALQLQDEDILSILSLTGFRFGKHELSALFRNPNQSQYRDCKDQVLRNFLLGLQLKFRKSQEE
ncbi:MAG: DUF1456 family protein [Cytophagaceae bacterium]|jgi:uncharacterized protein YehS (DUF1456 family)|nr:DUF1456 family protein [Cytophagaceae bacterium]